MKDILFGWYLLSFGMVVVGETTLTAWQLLQDPSSSTGPLLTLLVGAGVSFMVGGIKFIWTNAGGKK